MRRLTHKVGFGCEAVEGKWPITVWLSALCPLPSAVSSRMEAAGAQLMSWFGVACELHRDWRNDVEGLGRLFANHLPAYKNLMTSYGVRK